jgi:hypothetical protein
VGLTFGVLFSLCSWDGGGYGECMALFFTCFNPLLSWEIFNQNTYRVQQICDMMCASSYSAASMQHYPHHLAGLYDVYCINSSALIDHCLLLAHGGFCVRHTTCLSDLWEILLFLLSSMPFSLILHTLPNQSPKPFDHFPVLSLPLRRL